MSLLTRRARSLAYVSWLTTVVSCFAYSFFALQRSIPPGLSVGQTVGTIGSAVLAGISIVALATCMSRSFRSEPVVEIAGHWRVGLYSLFGSLIILGLALPIRPTAFPTILVHSAPTIAAVVATAWVAMAIRPEGARAARQRARALHYRDGCS